MYRNHIQMSLEVVHTPSAHTYTRRDVPLWLFNNTLHCLVPDIVHRGWLWHVGLSPTSATWLSRGRCRHHRHGPDHWRGARGGGCGGGLPYGGQSLVGRVEQRLARKPSFGTACTTLWSILCQAQLMGQILVLAFCFHKRKLRFGQLQLQLFHSLVELTFKGKTYINWWSVTKCIKK